MCNYRGAVDLVDVAVRGDLRRRLGQGIDCPFALLVGWEWQSEVISVGDLDLAAAITGSRRAERWQSEVISVGDLDTCGLRMAIQMRTPSGSQR